VAKSATDKVLKVSPARGTQAGVQTPIEIPPAIALQQRGRLSATTAAKPVKFASAFNPASAIILKDRAGDDLAPAAAGKPAIASMLPARPSTMASAKRTSGAFITGPLSSRRIVRKTIPAFPRWARKQGIGATISLQFAVMEDGTVKENVIVARTSGSKAWDDEVTKALKTWQFVPLKTQGRTDQSGVITFQFVIE
jgi:TonB family protein